MKRPFVNDCKRRQSTWDGSARLRFEQVRKKR